MTRISALYDFADFYGINLNNQHWIMTKNIPKTARQKSKILHDLVEELELNSHLYFKLKRLCWCKDCFNPFHYQLILPTRLPENVQKEMQNIKELAEDIELDKIYEMGIEDYLDYFNSLQLSELLKTDLKTLKKAIEFKTKFSCQ